MNKIVYKTKLLFFTFHTKLLVAFFICIVIPLIIIGNMLFHVTYQIASEKILDSILLVDDLLNVQINDRIKQTENVADSIQYSMYTLSNEMENLSDYISTFNQTRNSIYLYKTTFNFHHIFVFLPNEQMGASEGLYFFPLSDFSYFELDDYNYENPGTNIIWFYQRNSKIPFIISGENSNFTSIACCRISKNQLSGNFNYAYIISLNPNEFSNLLSETFNNNNITSYLISPNGYIMAHTNQEYCGKILAEEKKNSIIENINSNTSLYEINKIYYHTTELTNGWYHITEIPQNYLGQNTMILLQTIFISLIIIVPVTLCMIIFFSKNLTKRIKRLSIAMENFNINNCNTKSIVHLVPKEKDIALYDEIDKLSLTFTKMQTTLQDNIQSILSLSLSEEKLKYQLLQSQINPHFLYNILGTIKSCQSIGKLDIAEQMITKLAQFYRLSLRKSDDLILISDELKIARLYLEMEHLCRGDSLSWEINTEDGIENYLICKFTLQPFLENSILHGYSHNHSKIHISIDVIYGDDEVIIMIEDNGCGIEEEYLKNLQETLRTKIVNYEKHFGISNVNYRISSPSFGNGRVEIESQVGEGTKITLSFRQME